MLVVCLVLPILYNKNDFSGLHQMVFSQQETSAWRETIEIW